jgi:hypothetical protein
MSEETITKAVKEYIEKYYHYDLTDVNNKEEFLVAALESAGEIWDDAQEREERRILECIPK